MKPVDAKSNTQISSSKEINDNYTKLKIGNINIKIFLQKALWQISLNRFL